MMRLKIMTSLILASPLVFGATQKPFGTAPSFLPTGALLLPSEVKRKFKPKNSPNSECQILEELVQYGEERYKSAEKTQDPEAQQSKKNDLRFVLNYILKECYEYMGEPRATYLQGDCGDVKPQKMAEQDLGDLLHEACFVVGNLKNIVPPGYRQPLEGLVPADYFKNEDFASHFFSLSLAEQIGVANSLQRDAKSYMKKIKTLPKSGKDDSGEAQQQKRPRENSFEGVTGNHSPRTVSGLTTQPKSSKPETPTSDKALQGSSCANQVLGACTGKLCPRVNFNLGKQPADASATFDWDDFFK